jgi:hypothetical protein
MWVFQNDSFLSIVAHRDYEGHLLVRSRIKGDIERAFGDLLDRKNIQVWADSSADYKWRAIIPASDVANMLGAAALAVDYENFKDSIPKGRKHNARRLAYMEIWSVLARHFGAFGSTLRRVNPFGGLEEDPDIQAFLYGEGSKESARSPLE